MGSFGSGGTWNRGAGREGEGDGRGARRLTLLGAIIALLGTALLGPIQASAEGISASTGLASPPSWATSRRIHFEPSTSAASAYTSARSSHGLAGPLVIEGLEGEGGETLLYHPGGRGVQHTPKVYAIFWGSNWNKAPGSELRTSLLKLYEGLSKSAYQGILTQYFDPTGRVSSTVGVTSYTDTSVTAPSSVTEAKVEEEVNNAIKANKWTREFNAQFEILTAPGSTYNEGFVDGFCAYHSVTKEGESTYAFVPYQGDPPFDNPEGCLRTDKEHNPSHKTMKSASHEYAESATNPAPGATSSSWKAASGAEISDLCQNEYDLELPDGAWAQNLYDDHQNGCSHSDLEPPHVYAVTEAASEVKSVEAKLIGTVNPEGVETKYHFEYGKTISYGSHTSEVSAGSSVNNQTANQNITGLEPGTAYHFRLVAVNSTGTTYGVDKAFSTPLPSWTIQSTTNPPEGGPFPLTSISCASASVCTAVGHTGYSSSVTFVEHWNGSTWSTQSTPNPVGEASWIYLNGVSCPSTSACMAVGQYQHSGKGVSLAMSWNGSTWVIQSTPEPPGSSEYSLSGVSCTSASACTAVGEYHDSEGDMPLAERWNGTTWSIQTISRPTGMEGAQLTSVSCASTTACTAVGQAWEESDTMLAEHWNGTSWSVDTTLSESGWLNSVSCTSASACMVVGGEPSGSSGTPAAGRWNGTSWTMQTAPAPTKYSDELSGISCVSTSTCTAIGSYASSSREIGVEKPGNVLPYAVGWNGTAWSLQSMPNPAGTYNYLDTVSCASIFACTAAGASTPTASTSATLAERYAE